MRAGGARVGVGELSGGPSRAAGGRCLRSPVAPYFALRAVLCSRREDLEAFDAAFDGLFARGGFARAGRPTGAGIDIGQAGAAAGGGARGGAGADGVAARGADAVPAAWSDVELLRDKDFAEYTDAERRMARSISCGWRAVARAGEPAHARGAPPGRAPRAPAARTCSARCARSLRYGGEPVERHWREPRRAAAAGGARVRRVRLDGAVRADAAPVRAGLRGGAPAGRGLRVRHAADAGDRRAARARSRPGAGARGRGGGGLVGRHADRRCARHAQPRARPAARARRDRGGALRRVGPRRPGRCWRTRWRGWRRCAHRLVWLNPLKAQPGLRAADARA